jgi:hypothetical protein
MDKIRLKLEILNCRQKQKAVGGVKMANLSVEPQGFESQQCNAVIRGLVHSTMTNKIQS